MRATVWLEIDTLKARERVIEHCKSMVVNPLRQVCKEKAGSGENDE